MHVEMDDPDHLPALVRLNEEWITEHFSVEDADRQLARDPSAIRRGEGHTFAALEDGGVVGVAALFRSGRSGFELARMPVDREHRRRGIGRALANAAIAQATREGATEVTLLTNAKLEPAMALYRALGFETVREGPHPVYSRCDRVMRKSIAS